ncbi:MAG: hypothetical protein HY898_36890 [Deltaproteobacteria bacterium]|nr:hypothetical protein [Deltaproteobacteria bacterium]
MPREPSSQDNSPRTRRRVREAALALALLSVCVASIAISLRLLPGQLDRAINWMLITPGHEVSTPGAPRVRHYRSGGHATTLLADGRVLVCGGNSPTASAEVYDPSGVWTLVSPMSTARGSPSATLLADGRVLVAGGSSCVHSCKGEDSLSSAEIFHPGTGLWTPAASMKIGRAHHAASRLADGRVVVAGGIGVGSSSLSVISTAEVFNPGPGTWTLLEPMPHERTDARADTLPDGRMIVVGGMSWNHPRTPGDERITGDLFDPSTGHWKSTSPSPEEIAWSALQPDGSVLILDDRGDVAQSYSPATDLWTAHSATALWRYSSTSSSDVAAVPVVALSDGRLLATGGRIDHPSTANARMFDPLPGAVASGGAMATVRSAHTPVVLRSGRVLVFGGVQDWSGREKFAMTNWVVTSEVFDPVTGTWSLR